MTGPIRLLVSDVDGTLVTSDKVLTDASIDAVGRLHAAGIGFAVTSGRPPKGMAMLVTPLAITTPIGGFNGGLIVDPSMTILVQRVLPPDVVIRVVEMLGAHGLEAWLYRGTDWYVLDVHGAHVEREAFTVQFEPTVVASFAAATVDVAKVVGVSDDPTAVAAATVAIREQFGGRVAASTSQPYYLDVTHPEANKGGVIDYLSTALGIPADAIATIGDSENDAAMFARSGLSIAMGNAADGVQRAATCTTTSNDAEGFATAVTRFVLAT